MTETTTPICDLIAKLLSTGVSPGDALDAARIVEGANATGRASVAEQREKWRLKKQRQRQAAAKSPPGTKPVHISSSTLHESHKKTGKEESAVPRVPGTSAPVDDWPSDYEEQFWNAFPPGRKKERVKVAAKLERLRRDGYVDHKKQRRALTWAALMAGLERFKATRPEPQYTPAPIVWLNGQRWNDDEPPGGGGPDGGERVGNGRRQAPGLSATAEAAARRFGGGARNGPAPAPRAPLSPSAGLDAAARDAAASGHPAFQTDDGLGPERPVRR